MRDIWEQSRAATGHQPCASEAYVAHSMPPRGLLHGAPEYGFGDGQRKPRQLDRRPKSGRDLEGRGEKARVEQARILPKPPTTRAVAVVVGDSIAAARSR